MTAEKPQSAPVKPGDILAGKYRVERILGEGGMGVVVAATHTHLGQRVALKFLLPELSARPDIIARFDREARAAVRIQSEHVARVLDTGVLESGAPYMVMEYLEGSDLAQLVRKRGRLEIAEAAEFVLQACEVLAEAHVAGVVHRDLKPANLFITRRADGSPLLKVLDFGISKASLLGAEGPGAQPLTQTSAMMGSPRYMSPEQLRSSRDVDVRTDIWALGVVLHEMLTGEAAFLAPTMPELCISILKDPPPPLRSRRPDAPPALEAVILRCLEKDPARRFSNVAELAVALGEIAPPRARVSVERITRILQASGQATHLSVNPPAPGRGAGDPSQGIPPTQVGTTPGVSVSYTPAPGLPAPGPPAPGGYAPARSGYPPAAQPPPPPGGPGGPAGYPRGAPAGAYAPPGPLGPPGPFAPPGHHYASAPPPGYGPGSFPGAPMHASHAGPPPGYGPPPGAAQPPRPTSLHPSTVVLIVLAVLFATGMGGCALCVCIGAAAQP